MATVSGTNFNDFIHVAGDGNVPPVGANEIAQATSGSDGITTGEGFDTVLAGGGVDAVNYSGALAEHEVLLKWGGVVFVRKYDNVGPARVLVGIDELHDVERLQFTDGSYIDLTPGFPQVVFGPGDDDLDVRPSDGVSNNNVEISLYDGLNPSIVIEEPRAFHIYTGEGNDSVTFSGDFSNAVTGEWADGNFVPFFVSLGGGADTLNASFALADFVARPGYYTQQFLLSIDPGSGADLIDLTGSNMLAYVTETTIGGTTPGPDNILGGTAFGNWADFLFVPVSTGQTGVAVDLVTGTVTNAAVPVATTLANVQNVRGTNGHDSYLGNGLANFFWTWTGNDIVNGGAQEMARYDLAQATTYTSVNVNLPAGTMTGFSINATLTDIEGAVGSIFADTFTGNAFDNFFAGYGGNDNADGGGGTDIWSVQYARAFGTITVTGPNTITLTDTRASAPAPQVLGGVNTLTNMEFIAFTDALVPIDPTQPAVLKVHFADIFTGLLPGRIIGGSGSTDSLTIYSAAGPAETTIERAAFTETSYVLKCKQKYLDKLATTIIDDYESVTLHAEGKTTITGPLDGTGLSNNTLTIIGGAAGDTMDASGVTSLHRVVLQGLGGNDMLAGGLANDDLQGGGGSGDVASFLAATASIVHTLAATGAGSVTAAGMGTDTYSGIEGLIGGSANDRLTGNAIANVLGGHTGNDKLFGMDGNDSLDGGAGLDEMTGGIGNDSYYVDNAGDKTIEASGEGTDTVYSTVSRTLAANVEILRLQGAGNLTGNGNALANKIFGNAGDNLLQGADANDTIEGGDGADQLKGDAGDDSMIGGLGNDVFYVDSANDKTVEAAGGGADTVYSSVSRTLGANLETLRLIGAAGLTGTGNDLANKLFGNTGANLLQGLTGNDTLQGKDGADTLAGGEGNDTLTGGTGNDVFRFATANAGIDTITDFNQNQDKFDLGGGAFTAVGVAPNGDAVLTHTGGTIRINNPPTLTLAQWNALVLPAGTGAGGGPVTFGEDASAWHDIEPMALAARLQNHILHLPYGDWVFA